MSEIYELDLKPQFFRVTIDGKSVDFDPILANDAIAVIQSKHTDATETNVAVRDWLAEKIGVKPNSVDVDSALTFNALVVDATNAMTAERKKKRLPTANSLLSFLGYQPISESGQNQPDGDGSPTSAPSKPRGQDSRRRTRPIRSTASKTSRRKKPAQKKKVKRPA